MLASFLSCTLVYDTFGLLDWVPSSEDCSTSLMVKPCSHSDWMTHSRLQIYDGGSACDVQDIERTTEVRYVCSEGQDSVITSVREVHSCSYQIVIATPLICRHSAFRGVEVSNSHLCKLSF